MASSEVGSGFDKDAVRSKYLAERDRRLVPGRAVIRDLASDEHFGRYRDDPFTPYVEREAVVDEVDVVVVGAGIAGLLAGAELRRAGVERIRLIDKAGGVGGTWYWNRYPGVMCDVESYQYLPMLEELGYIPTRRYAFGDEIRGHLESIAERFDLTADALFQTGITRAEWDDDAARWRVTTDRGDQISCRYYVLAIGLLNLLKLPAIPGMEDFAGASFHTARWDFGYTGEELEHLAGKRVALLGTGASGIQVLPPLAEAAEHVVVFQRTPSAIGVRDNRLTDPGFADTLQPGWQRARMDNLQAIMLGQEVEVDLTDDGWTHHYAPVHRNPESFDYEVMEAHRQRVVDVVTDPVKAEILKPWYRYLCKRPCFHDEYLAAYNEPNVELVDCPAGIERITERGVVVDGHEHEVDLIVYGTGFEPELTPLARRAGHEVVGIGGVTLAEKFADGASTYLGMLSRGFPNLFVMPAPGQQSVVTVNYTQLAIAGADFVGRAVGLLDAKGAVAFDVAQEAEDEWVRHVVDTYIDGSRVMAACTPSRINNEGDPAGMNPRNSNWGRGYGDFFEYRAVLEGWVADGRFEGFELR